MVFKRPESILIVVYTVAGDVLMLRRVEPPDFWQSVTGSLEWDESPMDAACRELAEETGLAAQGLQDCGRTNRFPILPAWRARYASDVHENLEHVFRLRLPQRAEIRLNPAEHSEYQWLPKHEAATRATSWTNRDAILELVTDS